MNMGRNGVLAIAIGGAALLVLIGLARIPPAVAFLMALAWAGFLIYSRRNDRGVHESRRTPSDGRAEDSDQAYAIVPAVSDYRKHSVTEVSLPSSHENYRFLFSATVLWVPLDVPGDEPEHWTSTAAAGAIVQRASTLTVRHDPAHFSLACHELALALGRPLEVEPQRILVKATDVQLVLSDEDSERLARLAEMRKDEDIREHERRHEQSLRAYLADDVLKDPGSAVVWWLARHGDGDMGRAAANIKPLMQVFNAANNLGAASANGWAETQKSPVDHLVGFLRSIDATEDSRVLFACRVARIAESQDQDEVAEQIRRRFGVIADDPLEQDDAMEHE